MTSYIPKTMNTTKGEHYYGVRCAKTRLLLAIDDDPSQGRDCYAEPHNEVEASCHHCQSVHLFPGSTIFYFVADGSE
jgi:hypothetical protein